MDYPLRESSGRDTKHWRGFTEELLEVGTPVELVSIDVYRAMTAEARASYDSMRRKTITAGLMVRNDSFLRVQEVLMHVMREHQCRSGGGHGVLVSADSYMGKTTVAKMLMYEILQQRLRDDPECLARGEVPVAYVNLPSTGTPLGLYRALAYFYGLPIGVRETEATLEGMVQHAVNTCRTHLLVIDDVHNLKYGGVHSAKVSAAIRRLGDDINCPILLEGIALERTTLLTGYEGAQIFERYRSAEMSSYTAIDAAGTRSRWRKLVKGFLIGLPLFGDNSQCLGPLAGTLHRLTDGRIGELNSILSRASLDLIEAGDPDQEVLTIGLARAKADEILAENAFKQAMRREALRKTTARQRAPSYD